MIQIKGQAGYPSGIDVAITVTMPLADWEKLLEIIPTSGYPYWKFRAGVAKVILAIRGAYTETVEEL